MNKNIWRVFNYVLSIILVVIIPVGLLDLLDKIDLPFNSLIGMILGSIVVAIGVYVSIYIGVQLDKSNKMKFLENFSVIAAFIYGLGAYGSYGDYLHFIPFMIGLISTGVSYLLIKRELHQS